MNAKDLDKIDVDAPLFDAAAFRLGEEEAELNALARRIGRSRLAPCAAEYDRDARFPTENYRDMRDAGLLGICVPKAHGGLGAGFRAYSTSAAELGRYCGSTALGRKQRPTGPVRLKAVTGFHPRRVGCSGGKLIRNPAD
jgi:alkylation response protein AidB-like acyl-CoA dehydrogenase